MPADVPTACATAAAWAPAAAGLVVCGGWVIGVNPRDVGDGGGMVFVDRPALLNMYHAIGDELARTEGGLT